ncbi:DUF4876 domain-containing protein [Flavobacterium quisquiliarum]|uniref:DUF4876 domain-containing protein n=1 Tax=Flavobacterium quisquiliarum TaxID=1834436 RepID=A0ABV8W9L8_9FLAO|nr:DUF4876 domain-containing protein [Flavobacterium quisquiliarum]MBW1658296.1 DUF4876 domain-containing protein [Flavobacterium quisquiliarum]NWL02175.1 DUF4876 domain-containing protein [Flavobacterium collinsii]
MKKTLSIFILLFALIIQSCSNDDNENEALKPVDFSVSLKYDVTFNSQVVKKASVTIVNTETANKYTVESDESGVATFKQILPGTYTITATKVIASAEFTETFGYTPTETEINFNGAESSVIVNATTPTSNIEMKTSKVGDFVIKQIYYAGSDTKKGAIFRDQFIEIYNNSNTVQYADGLYMALLTGSTSTTVLAYSLPNGQFDWSKSEGMTEGSTANTDYVYALNIIKIPGSGTQYPVQPGTSIVIAQNGINHKANYVDNKGKAVSILSPELTVDLSTADFESFLGDYSGDLYQYDIQNPNVPDVNIAYWGNSNNDMILDSNGRHAYVIFKMTDAEFTALKKYKNPKGDANLALQIPVSVLIDGVDTTKDLGSNLVPKKLPSQIDGGNTYVPSGAYSSKSVMRKTKTTIAGRIVLQDTNNSTNDFVEVTANPRGFN